MPDTGTPWYLPYPDLADEADAPKYLSQLAVSMHGGLVAADDVDSGWTLITITAPFTVHPDVPPSVRKIGSVVYMRGAWTNASVTANGTLGVGTLPAGFVPAPSFYLPAGMPTGATTAQFLIGSGSGTGIQLRVGPTVATYFYIHGTYTID